MTKRNFPKADEKLDFNEKIGGTFSSSILQTSTSLCNKLSKSLRNFVKNQAFPATLFFIFDFSIMDSGFEPGSSSAASDHSVNYPDANIDQWLDWPLSKSTTKTRWCRCGAYLMKRSATDIKTSSIPTHHLANLIHFLCLKKPTKKFHHFCFNFKPATSAQ